MWSAGSETASVFLGLDRVGVITKTPPSHAGMAWMAVASSIEGWREAAELLTVNGRRPRTTLFLSGALARPFIFDAVQGLKRWCDAQQVAASLASDATGLRGPCDVWLDEWMPNKPCIAVAIERSFRESIESLGLSTGLRLRAIRPWWTRALDVVAADTSASPRMLAVEDTDSLTLLIGEDGDFTSALSYVPRPDSSQRQALLSRAMLGSNSSPDQGVLATMETNGSHGESDRKDADFNVHVTRVA